MAHSYSWERVSCSQASISQYVSSVLPKPTPVFQFLGLLLAPSCFALLGVPWPTLGWLPAIHPTFYYVHMGSSGGLTWFLPSRYALDFHVCLGQSVCELRRQSLGQLTFPGLYLYRKRLEIAQGLDALQMYVISVDEVYFQESESKARVWLQPERLWVSWLLNWAHSYG